MKYIRLTEIVCLICAFFFLTFENAQANPFQAVSESTLLFEDFERGSSELEKTLSRLKSHFESLKENHDEIQLMIDLNENLQTNYMYRALIREIKLTFPKTKIRFLSDTDPKPSSPSHAITLKSHKENLTRKERVLLLSKIIFGIEGRLFRSSHRAKGTSSKFSAFKVFMQTLWFAGIPLALSVHPATRFSFIHSTTLDGSFYGKIALTSLFSGLRLFFYMSFINRIFEFRTQSSFWGDFSNHESGELFNLFSMLGINLFSVVFQFGPSLGMGPILIRKSLERFNIWAISDPEERLLLGADRPMWIYQTWQVLWWDVAYQILLVADMIPALVPGAEALLAFKIASILYKGLTAFGVGYLVYISLKALFQTYQKSKITNDILNSVTSLDKRKVHLYLTPSSQVL